MNQNPTLEISYTDTEGDDLSLCIDTDDDVVCVTVNTELSVHVPLSVLVQLVCQLDSFTFTEDLGEDFSDESSEDEDEEI
mgnify:CR=1 FL=1